jgi:hypothetical protein
MQIFIKDLDGSIDTLQSSEFNKNNISIDDIYNYIYFNNTHCELIFHEIEYTFENFVNDFKVVKNGKEYCSYSTSKNYVYKNISIQENDEFEIKCPMKIKCSMKI